MKELGSRRSSSAKLARALTRAVVASLFVTLVSACAIADGHRSGDATNDQALTSARYPIVLAHGFFGFKTFAGIDFLTYYFGVESYLKEHGETQIFTPEVDPFNDSTARGAQLEARIVEILKQTGAQKVNIIGHSQGGLDARVVAHNRPDIVASVTTIGSPHIGSHLSDTLLAVGEVPLLGDLEGRLADSLVRLVGAPIWDQIGKDTSVTRALRQVTTDGMRRFNAEYTDSPGVRYFSIAGRTARSDGGEACRSPQAPAFLAQTVKVLDTTDLLLDVPELVTSGFPLEDEPNDGFVRVNEARWGTFLGCIPADHLDEIGQLAGDRAGDGNDWSYLEFYRELVGFLRASGI